jgi:glycosyltransferase involved in cell wall biosynthesis
VNARVSIAMAAYNGAKYLNEQLDSFQCQTRRPDELVVCDDGSTDATHEILEKYQRHAPFEVRIHRNKKNLGYARNFEIALSLCVGDIIFLSDQDDVWFRTKLERIGQAFGSNPGVHIVVNDQEITDADLSPSGRTIFENTKALGYGKNWISAGCCTAITRQFRDLATPFPTNLIAHDAWIHRFGQGLGVRLVLPEVLQYYRRHDQNASLSAAAVAHAPRRWDAIMAYGLKDASAGWERELKLSRFICERLADADGRLGDTRLAETVSELMAYETARQAAIAKRIQIVESGRRGRPLAVLQFSFDGGYRYFSGWKSALKDLLR